MTYGTVTLNGQSINYIWPSDLERIPTIWYTICFIFDAQDGSLGMFINNIQSIVAQSQHKYKGSVFDIKSPIEFGNCKIVLQLFFIFYAIGPEFEFLKSTTTPNEVRAKIILK